MCIRNLTHIHICIGNNVLLALECRTIKALTITIFRSMHLTIQQIESNIRDGLYSAQVLNPKANTHTSDDTQQYCGHKPWKRL